jgi:hypothetical protein
MYSRFSISLALNKNQGCLIRRDLHKAVYEVLGVPEKSRARSRDFARAKLRTGQLRSLLELLTK